MALELLQRPNEGVDALHLLLSGGHGGREEMWVWGGWKGQDGREDQRWTRLMSAHLPFLGDQRWRHARSSQPSSPPSHTRLGAGLQLAEMEFRLDQDVVQQRSKAQSAFDEVEVDSPERDAFNASRYVETNLNHS